MANRTIASLVIIAALTVLLKGNAADEPEKLVNGYVAIEGEFPFAVSLRYRGQHICGGTLITRKHVLTAAHCVHQKQHNQFTVQTGTILLDSGGETHNVKHIHPHPSYIHNIASSYIHDIALITLVDPIVDSNVQSPISVASGQTPGNVQGEIVGWGRTKVNGSASGIQRKSHTQILDLDDCREKSRYTIYETQICTLEQVGTGVCNGDSGGPLLYNNEIVGVISLSYLCASGVPDVFTRVFSYRDFIQDAIKRYD